jgi:hypothetical protein
MFIVLQALANDQTEVRVEFTFHTCGHFGIALEATTADYITSRTATIIVALLQSINEIFLCSTLVLHMPPHELCEVLGSSCQKFVFVLHAADLAKMSMKGDEIVNLRMSIFEVHEFQGSHYLLPIVDSVLHVHVDVLRM